MALGRGLAKVGITANALTYSSLALATVAGVAAGMGHLYTAACLVIVSGICDLLDGVVARATGGSTRFGALLDSTVDRLADGLPLLGLVVLYAQHGALAAIPALAMIGGFVVSYVRARAEGLGVTLPPLFMRRAERVILVSLSLLLGGVYADQAPFIAPLTLLGVAVMGTLNFVGATWAVRAAKRALDGDPSAEQEELSVSVTASEQRGQP